VQQRNEQTTDEATEAGVVQTETWTGAETGDWTSQWHCIHCLSVHYMHGRWRRRTTW